MKITNKYNLPEELVAAVENREYSKGDADYSATGLLQPPQIQILTGWNYSHLTADVADSIWSLFGSAVHHILDSAADKQQLTEQRLYAELNGVKISGMFDRYEKSLFSIDDWKVTSVWKATKGDFDDWTAQLNIYHWLFKVNFPDIPVEKLRIHAILRDWSFREAKKSAEIDGSYPPSQVHTINIPVWEMKETIKFITYRINQVELAKKAVNATELAYQVPCSNEDRWAKPDSWVVFNTQKNRTQKKFTADEYMTLDMCETEARLKVAGMQVPGYKAILRKGENIRCDNFCLVSKFCAQYRAMNTNEVDSNILSVEDAAKGLTNE